MAQIVSSWIRTLLDDDAMMFSLFICSVIAALMLVFG